MPSSGEMRHDLLGEELKGFDVAFVVAIDRQLDTSILVLPDKMIA